MFKSVENNHNAMSQESISRLYGDKFSAPAQNDNYTPSNENKIAVAVAVDLGNGDNMRAVFKNGATYVSVNFVLCKPHELKENAILALTEVIRLNEKLHEKKEAHLTAIKYSLEAIESNKRLREEGEEQLQESANLLRSVRDLFPVTSTEHMQLVSMLEAHALTLEALIGKRKIFMINETTQDIDFFVDYQKVTSMTEIGEIVELCIPIALHLHEIKSKIESNETWDDNWRD